MASVMLATVKIPNFNGMAKDTAVNNWAFMEGTGGPAPVPSTLPGIVQVVLSTFYTAIHTGLSGHYDWAHAPLECYDITTHLDGGPHGSPIYTGLVVGSAAPSALTALPAGLCVCVSYRSDFGTDLEEGPSVSTIPTADFAQDEGAPATHTGRTRPKSRDRGRLYIGPLDQGIVDSTTGLTGESRPGGTFLDTLRHAAYQVIIDATLAAAGARWAQWSRRNATVKIVNGGNVANSFTYQRGREIAPSSRPAIGP